MASIRAYSCRRCRAEAVVTLTPRDPVDYKDWSPPVLCCGQPLRPLAADQVVFTPVLGRRTARCPRCGYQVRIIVQPAGALTCLLCQRELAGREHVGRREDRGVAPLAPGSRIRR